MGEGVQMVDGVMGTLDDGIVGTPSPARSVGEDTVFGVKCWKRFVGHKVADA